MTVTATNSATNTTAASSSTTAKPDKNAMNYDAFLKLLVAQMQNQDPTSPSDSAQYLSQLASFASVEQGVGTNTRLDQILSSTTLGNAQGLIGKTASNADKSISGIVDKVEINGQSATIILKKGERLPLDKTVIIGAA